MDKLKLKKFALKHPLLLTLYRHTVGKLKTSLYFGAQRKILQTKGLEVIKHVADSLDNSGTLYFVDCGTLLGIIRNKKLIEYDRDIDFGIYFNEKFQAEDLDKLMNAVGFKRHSSFYYRGELKEVTYVNGLTHIDFFSHTECSNSNVTYGFYRNPDYEYPTSKHVTVLEFTKARIKGVKKIFVNGFMINVPINFEEYLESCYTKNWRVPDPAWSYMSCPGLREIKDDFGILHV